VLGRAPDEYDTAFMRRMADAYDRRTAWTRLRLAAVDDLVQPRRGERVVDLGCAAGSITDHLGGHGCDPVGVDSSPDAIALARERFPRLRFVQANVRELPFGDRAFDKAVAADLVEHLDDETLTAMLGEVRRVLAPGGTFSIYTPNPLHVIERMKARGILLAQNPTHIGLRTAPALVSMLERAGLRVDVDGWRPSFYPVLRTIERHAGRHAASLRYRLCIRAAA
jgi:SAM-dependent methyltransferase